MSTTVLQRLYPLQVATGTIPRPDGQALTWPIVCYLVTTSDNRSILIDTGLPSDYPHPAGMPQPQFHGNVVTQLAQLGVSPDDISQVICTHLDIDHAGYHDAFPQAEFVIQREHYLLASSGHPRYALVRAHWDHPALRYCLISGDTELVPGLTLLETSGHVPGHQSVLLHLPETGPVLLAIDAVVLQRLFTPERRATSADDNEEQLRASTRKLLDLVEQEGISLVIFGHDGQQWQTLKKLPEYYV